MDNTFAVFRVGIGRAAICEVESIEDELHVLMRVLLLVACECLELS
jgi:hypothetical protein